MKIISENVTRGIGRKILKVKKNSPHIFFVGGVVGVVGSTVLACRATLKLEKTIDDIKKDFDVIEELKKAKNESAFYTNQDHARDVGHVFIKSAVSLGKLYGPSVVIGAASITALTGSHIQLTRRNAALSATLAVVSKAYDDYRVRVQEELGKERELDIYRAMKKEEIEIDGKKKIVKVTDPEGVSPYARFFDEGNPNWQNDAELNRIFLQCQQNYANHKLRARGHVFLNEVYDSLGLERSQSGQVVGWIMNGDGDGYIDFGLFEAGNTRFVNGFEHLERSVILDFNVDGVVYDKI